MEWNFSYHLSLINDRHLNNGEVHLYWQFLSYNLLILILRYGYGTNTDIGIGASLEYITDTLIFIFLF